MLIHGITKTMFTFRKVIRSLANKHPVLAVDVRGFGKSEGPISDDDCGTIASDIIQVADEVDFGKFCVVGEDWGITYADSLQPRSSDSARVPENAIARVRLEERSAENWEDGG